METFRVARNQENLPAFFQYSQLSIYVFYRRKNFTHYMKSVTNKSSAFLLLSSKKDLSEKSALCL